jgi:hypothetical protein
MDVESMASGKNGFPLLAQRIALSPDYESFIFRKFDRLSARNLLHLEGKLAYLEHKLDQTDEKAALPSADNESRRSIRAWEAFEENALDPLRPEHVHMKLVEQVQETLKEYRKFCVISYQIEQFLTCLNRRSFTPAKPNSGSRSAKESGIRRRTQPVPRRYQRRILLHQATKASPRWPC